MDYFKERKQITKIGNYKDGCNVEVVDEFKLLGKTIDHILLFNKYVDRLKSSVNQKLYSIKKLFYLSPNIKFQFFKTLIQPHFDYCSSQFISTKLV